MAFIILVTWLRHRPFSSDPILFSYLQMVGGLLSFTFAANALVRFRGTHDRLTLILAFGFVLAGLIETITVFGFYSVLSSGLSTQLHIPLAWMVSRTLLAVLILAALTVEKRLPSSRDPSREIFVALIVVGVVAYLTSAAFLSYPVEPAIHPLARIARPWDLLPALLFLVAAVVCRQRLRHDRSAFDYALWAACWLNVLCHVAASQSERLLDGPFTLAQVLKVTSYAVVLGGALLDNARLFDQVHHLAATDSLTGLGNYRTLVQTLEAEIQRSRRTGRPFALLLLDLDALKSVNDRYGHLVGSSAIRRLAAKMRTSCRTMDTAARYGGDEFAVVLPEADMNAATAVGRRICDRLAQDGETPSITCSVGAAVFPRDGASIEQLFAVADSALYRMKGHGESAVNSLARIAACL
ncbi:MAG: GGDEF domain-containing protein [Candidatus Acidiferrales bacterium]